MKKQPNQQATSPTRLRLIESVAALVRSTYVHHRQLHETQQTGRSTKYIPGPRWDGGRSSDGKNYDPIWPKIAKFMLDHQLNVVQCIWHRFQKQAGPGRQAPLPNQIPSMQWLDEYRQLDTAMLEEIRTKFCTEQQTFRIYMHTTASDLKSTKNDAWDLALLNMQQPWSPLFRYCIAVREKLDSIAERFHQSALLQYLSSPTNYQTVWGPEWIPADLQETVDAYSIPFRRPRAEPRERDHRAEE